MTKKFGHGVLERVQMYVVAPLDSVTALPPPSVALGADGSLGSYGLEN